MDQNNLKELSVLVSLPVVTESQKMLSWKDVASYFYGYLSYLVFVTSVYGMVELNKP